MANQYIEEEILNFSELSINDNLLITKNIINDIINDITVKLIDTIITDKTSNNIDDIIENTNIVDKTDGAIDAIDAIISKLENTNIVDETDNSINDIIENTFITDKTYDTIIIKKNDVVIDITKDENIVVNFNNSAIKKWIKLIPFSKTYDFETYKRKDNFIYVANIILDDELNVKSKKKRNTLIKFVPQIDQLLYNEESEWIYIFLVNDRIVKIGGTRTGLKGRVSSYLCGHHIEERGKSGDCSKTNGYIYNTFYFYLLNNADIKMFAFQIPVVKQVYNILDKNCEIKLQTYHAYESIYIEDFKQLYGEIPFLCDNSDPNYQK
jgi:hypothetical protein